MKILKLGLTLMIVSAVAAFGLSAVYSVTKDGIAIQNREEQIKAVKQVIPQVKKSKDFQERKDLYPKLKKKYKGLDKIFEGFKDGKRVGTGVQVLSRGYGGFIKMVVGIDSDGKVTGAAIVEHKETPGLGSGIEEAKWRRQFKNKTVDDPVEVGKDIDAITGATKSSKAVTEGVKEALEIYKDAY